MGLYIDKRQKEKKKEKKLTPKKNAMLCLAQSKLAYGRRWILFFFYW